MRNPFILLIVWIVPLAGTAAAQDALEEAKAQYASAAYEEALTALNRADAVAGAKKVEVEQYRAFCYIALGRTADAEQAVASLVATDPRYLPSPNVASPKVLQMVSEMRRKELPGVARKLLDEGRAAYQEKQLARAQQVFRLLAQVLDDPAMKQRPETSDLRVLADGFVTLTEAAAAAPKREPATVAAATPAPLGTAGGGPNGTHANGDAPAVEPPAVIHQVLPVWEPPDELAGARDYLGSIKVTIGIDGRVKSATIETATHPIYDARLLQAARTWLYKPARRNGQAVESEKVIAFNLRRKN